MAAPSRHVGRYFQRNSRLLINNVDQLWGHRSFGWTPAVQQQAAETCTESTEAIAIPMKKTWKKEAVLEALASTVSRDPTAFPYQFQDDSYLAPTNITQFKLNTLALESGKAAAKFFLNTHPSYFAKDYAEPHIPCLMPETVKLLIEDVSEEALKERISLRRVKAAVEMYDSLLQTGTAISMETTHDLLDLICFYGDQDPEGDPTPEVEGVKEEEEEEVKEEEEKENRVKEGVKGQERSRGLGPQAPEPEWKENNNAERIFNLLPEKDTRCYSAMIRGMVKYKHPVKAFDLFTEMQNNRVKPDLHIFHAMIAAAPDVRFRFSEKWELISDLLNQMNQQELQPTLQTFNCLLKTLRRCGLVNKPQALFTLREMLALGIEPCLASYDRFLRIFYKPDSLQSSDFLQQILDKLEGQRLTCQDPEDGLFFMTAMKCCVYLKDLDLAYKVHNLLEVGENWRFLSDSMSQMVYYGTFFNLLCMMENIDVVLHWYKRLIPSVFYPNVQCMKNLLQVLDTDNRLDLLPSIWEDMRDLGHHHRMEMVEEVLQLMVRDEQTPEVQKSFAACALSVRTVINEQKKTLAWTKSSMSNVAVLLLRDGKIDIAWDLLQEFETRNLIPAEQLMKDFLTVFHGEGNSMKAVELVKLSALHCLSITQSLLTQTLAEFNLNEEQRMILSELVQEETPSE